MTSALPSLSLPSSDPFVQTVEQGGVFFTLFPERVPQSTAAKMCTQLDGGRLAVLPSRALVNMVGERLLRTVPLKHSLQAAWTAVAGINAMGLHAQMHDGGLHHDNASTCFKPTAKGVLMLQLLTERSLHWYNSSHASLDESSAATGNQPVDGGLLAHLQQLKLRWTVHDLLAQQLAVPMTAEQVCGQLVMQLSDEIGPRTDATPGIWWFDCERAAPFICECEQACGLGLHCCLTHTVFKCYAATCRCLQHGTCPMSQCKGDSTRWQAASLRRRPLPGAPGALRWRCCCQLQPLHSLPQLRLCIRATAWTGLLTCSACSASARVAAHLMDLSPFLSPTSKTRWPRWPRRLGRWRR